MTAKWQITILAVPPSLNVTKRMFWNLLRDLKKRWWLLIHNSLVAAPIPPATCRRRIDVTVWTASELQDDDNLRGGCKEVLTDNLKPGKREVCTYRKGSRAGQRFPRESRGHGLILDDNAQWLEWGEFRQIRVGAEDQERTVVVLTDCREQLTEAQRRDEVMRWALDCRTRMLWLLEDKRDLDEVFSARQAARDFLEQPLPGALKAFEVSNA